MALGLACSSRRQKFQGECRLKHVHPLETIIQPFSVSVSLMPIHNVRTRRGGPASGQPDVKAFPSDPLLGKSLLVATLGSAGRWTLLVVVLGLALIGFLHLTRGTAVRHVRGVAADGAAISVSEPEFALMATMATGAWLGPGNHVDVMQNGDGTFPRLWDDLRSTHLSITLQLYYGAPGRMADTLSEILRDRAKAGVRVFVLYDAFGTVGIPRYHRGAEAAASRERVGICSSRTLIVKGKGTVVSSA